MTSPPIACTLPADERPERVALIDALARDALLGRQPIPGGVRLRLRDAPGIEERVRDLVAAESRCCAFLSFALGRDADGLWLDVSGAP